VRAPFSTSFSHFFLVQSARKSAGRPAGFDFAGTSDGRRIGIESARTAGAVFVPSLVRKSRIERTEDNEENHLYDRKSARYDRRTKRRCDETTTAVAPTLDADAFLRVKRRNVVADSVFCRFLQKGGSFVMPADTCYIG